jgi:hypothetical protein
MIQAREVGGRGQPSSIMNKISFDANEEGGFELARAIMLERLRRDKSWNQLISIGKSELLYQG